MDVVNLDRGFDSIEEYWEPTLAGELNGQAVKLAKAQGEFVWHHHEDADEFFYVHTGELRIELEARDDVTLEAGEFTIVPRGVEHRPVAETETEIMLFEPSGTVNTGNVEGELTRTDLESLSE
ncbi:MAG: cupin domain-containing protein [Halodesulfurarchaeum sp.]